MECGTPSRGPQAGLPAWGGKGSHAPAMVRAGGERRRRTGSTIRPQKIRIRRHQGSPTCGSKRGRTAGAAVGPGTQTEGAGNGKRPRLVVRGQHVFIDVPGQNNGDKAFLQKVSLSQD